MKKRILLLVIMISLLMYGCSKSSEPEIINFEGESDNWTAFSSIPSNVEDEEYIKVTFICSSVEDLFSDRDVISFAFGTSVGSAIYSYHKVDGYITPYSSNPTGLERVTCVSDDTFEVLYDIYYIDTNIRSVSEYDILCYASGESIDLIPVE